MLTQTELKKIVYYDPETGIFTWKIRLSGRTNIGETLYSKRKDGYLQVRIKGEVYRQHRLAFLYMTGRIPKYVDHIDCDRANNKWNNLRVATRSQNNANVKLQQNNTSGYKGVYLYKDCKLDKPWYARIKNIRLGYFKTAKEAAIAYDKKAIELYGEYARLNFKK